MTGSAIHIWKAATGGGRPVDYLRWLSAMWELFANEWQPEHYGRSRPALLSEQREDFYIWLTARFYESLDTGSTSA